MDLFTGVGEGLAGDRDLARILDNGRRIDDPGVECRHRGERLVDRADRVGAGDRPVEHRGPLILVPEPLCLGLAQGPGEDRRVDGRVGAEREGLAGANVKGDECPWQPDTRERGLASRLEAEVDRQPDRIPGHRIDRVEGSPDPAQRVHLEPGRPRLPAEYLVVSLLEPGLADRVASLQLPGSVLVQLLGGHLADAAEQVCRQGSLGVAPDEDAADHDLGETLPVLPQVEDDRVVDVVDQGHRGARWVVLDLGPVLPANPVGRPIDHRSELEEQLPPLLGVDRDPGRVQLEGGAGPVADQDATVAIEDLAPGRPDPELEGAIRPGLCEVFIAGDHLERPEPHHQHAEEYRGEDAEDHRPGEAPTSLPAACVGSLTLLENVLHRSPMPSQGTFPRAVAFLRRRRRRSRSSTRPGARTFLNNRKIGIPSKKP